MTALGLHQTGESYLCSDRSFIIPLIDIFNSISRELSARFPQSGSAPLRNMEREQEVQSNSEWSFDDDNFCDEICNGDNGHTSSASSDVIVESVHDEPDRHNRLCESITVIAETEDPENDKIDFNNTSNDSSTVVVRSEDTPDNEGHADLFSLAESEGVQSQAIDEEKVQTVPKEYKKAIKGVAKRIGVQDATRTLKVKKVQKKKKMSVTAQKKIRDDRFFAGLDLETDT